MNDYDIAILKIKEAREAAANCKGEPLIDLRAAVQQCALSYFQLLRAVRTKVLTSFAVGDVLDGETASRYLVRMSDVKRLVPAKRGRPRKTTSHV